MSDPFLTNSYDQQSYGDRDSKPSQGPYRLRSPFPPDPGHGIDTRIPKSAYNPTRSLRLRGSSANTIYKKATASTGAPFRLDVRCSQSFNEAARTGKPARNHMNENLKRMRRIMRETQQRTAAKEQKPLKALWRLKQFDNVESKDEERASSRPQSAQSNFLRAHKNTGPQYLRSQSACDVRRDSKSSSTNEGKTKVDFVKMNSKYVKTLPKTRKTAVVEAAEKAQENREKLFKSYDEKQKGRTPDYIEKLKEKRDHELAEARANAPDPECPPGHTKIDNAQRLATLEKLQSKRAEFQSKYYHLPIRNDSVRLRTTKEELEKRIVELDEAISIFSKPKVFIKNDQ